MNFDNLPHAVHLLQGQVQEIKQMLLQIASSKNESRDQFLNLSQAADFLELAHPTVYGLVSRKEIPVSKRGNRLYFSKQELTDWIKAGRKKTKEEISSDADAHLATVFKSKRKNGSYEY